MELREFLAVFLDKPMNSCLHTPASSSPKGWYNVEQVHVNFKFGVEGTDLVKDGQEDFLWVSPGADVLKWRCWKVTTALCHF